MKEMIEKDKLNFFVIGAAKAGTTTVFERLNAREDVYLSPLKEPNYYSSDIDTSKFSPEFKANTRLDLSEYFSTSPLQTLQIGFVRDSREYASLFEPAPSSAILLGECSTSYLWSSAAPSLLKADHPSAQILIMLRNPIDRLFSHYMMARKYGFTKLPLREAVEKDLTHPSPGWGASELFVELGMYSEQINRWKAQFPDSSIKIMLTEDLRSPEKWNELIDWLGLPKDSETNTSLKSKSDANTAGLAKFEGLNRFLTSRGLKHKLGNLIPKGLKRRLVNWYYSSENLPKISVEERKYLMSLYSEEIEKLRKDFGLKVEHWKK
ncbi:MAG: hypothetical protein COA49_03885 [Bacteroidetes bacterium]|nr:MAG: hypothetical protein COA49_03885 [Bacteroidota bacterium]